MFDHPEVRIDSSLAKLDNTSNPLYRNSLNPLQPDEKGLNSQQILTLAGETLIDAWQNHTDPTKALVYSAESIFNTNFAANAQIAFGDNFDVHKAEALGADILRGNYGVLPDVQFLFNAQMNGALGAYAKSSNTIYLNSVFLSQNADNPTAIGKVLVEEQGHFLDVYANRVDSPGDEGEILAGLVQGKVFNESELIPLKAEDDSSVFTINGKLVSVECASSRTEIVLGNKVDFNGDGRSDFIRQEKGSFATDNYRMFETYLSNGDGAFRKAWEISNSNNMHGDLTNLFMGDFNGDGRTDFLRQEKGAFASDQWSMLETFISNGDGSFTSRSVMHDGAMNGDLTNLFIGDFNGDGKSDFIRQEKGSFATDNYRMFETYLSNGDGSFRKAWEISNSNNMHGDLTNLFMGDFNGDGRTDFLRQEKGAFASDQWSMLETFISNGDGSFTSRSVMHDGAMNGDLTNLFIGDFNGDGKSDFIRQEKGSFATDNYRMFETYLSNGDGSFRKAWEISNSNNMHGDLTNLFMGDFNGDGRTDFLKQEKGAFATDNDWMLETFISNGNGSFTSRYAMHDGGMNGDLTKLFVGDFDGNGRADLLRQERGSFATDNYRMLDTYTSSSDGSFTKRWQADDGSMHGDLTNLFTNNTAYAQLGGGIRTPLPPQPGGGTRTPLPMTQSVGLDYFKARSEFYTTGNIFWKSSFAPIGLGNDKKNNTPGNTGTEGNCTWYVHGRVKELGGSSAALNSMSGNANQWHNQLSNGARIVGKNEVEVGDIAQWTRLYKDPKDGKMKNMNHVAVVEKVYTENGVKKVSLSESHYSTDTDKNGIAGTLHRIFDYRADEPDRYIRVPKA